MNEYSIKVYRMGDETQVCELVTAVFREFIAPDYSAEGQCLFEDYCSAEKIAARQSEGWQMFLIHEQDALIGVLELRHFEHISMLFVAASHQRRGVARALVNRATSLVKRVRPDLETLSVYASPYAQKIYRKLGFEPESEELNCQGIRYTPMRKALK